MSEKRTALITGASSGIGYELALIFAREGHDLVLVARREDRLQKLAEELKSQYQTNVRVIGQDLTQINASREIYLELERASVAVDILVNNAGFGYAGPFEVMDLKKAEDMIELNITALTQLCRLFVVPMIERGHGKILNVASTASFQPGPLMAVYYATKAYVLSFSEAIRAEFKQHGIGVTALCPGPTISEFQKEADLHGARVLRMPMMTSKQVAEQGYRALMKNKTLIVTGWLNKLFAFIVRLTPRAIVTRCVHLLQQRVRH